MVKFNKILLADKQIYPHNPYSTADPFYSDNNWNEYQSLVNATGSVQFVNTGKRYRFNNACYIGNRKAVNVDGSTFSVVDIDTLSVISSTPTTANGRIWYFGNNRVLTRIGILDFQGNVVTSFSTNFRSVCPGLPGVVWANDSSYNIYKGIVDGDNITFTKVGTGGTDQNVGSMYYGRLGAYQINSNDTSGSGNCTYVNPNTNALTNFSMTTDGRWDNAVSGADGKLYRLVSRTCGFGRLQKISTTSEGLVGNSLSTSWTQFGLRSGKFLGNIVSGGMNSNNGTGYGYGSNSYFINTSGTLTLAQSNAFAYDTNIHLQLGFIDENGWLYPHTSGGGDIQGNGVILKTDKTFTNLPWRNPFLRR